MNKYQIRSLHVIRKFVPDFLSVNAETMWQVVLGSMQNGHRPEIVCTAAGSEIKQESAEGIEVNRFRYKYPHWKLSESGKNILDKFGGDPLSPELIKYVKQKKDIDLWHFHFEGRIPARLRRLALKRHIPYLVSLYCEREIPANDEAEMIEKVRKQIIDYGKVKDLISGKNKLLSDAAGIICYDLSDYNRLKQQYPQKPLLLLNSGYIFDQYQAAHLTDFRKKYHIPSTSELILCDAPFMPESNQIRLIELAHHLNASSQPVHILLICKLISPAYLPVLRRKIAALKIEDQVTIITDLDRHDADLVKAYETADYFILPALRFVQQRPILKAWTSRLPIIAHKFDGIEQLIQQHKNGLLYEEDTLEALLAELKFLRNNSEFRVRLIRNSCEAVKEDFSWEKINEQIAEFYEQLLRKKPEK